MATNLSTSATDPSLDTTDKTDPATPGMVEQFNVYNPFALAIPDGEVRPMKLDAELVVYNGEAGIQIVVTNRDRLLAEVPAISFDEIDSLHGIGQGLLYANGKVERLPPISSEARAAFTDAHKWRRVMMDKATVAVNEGIIPAAAVEAIRRGQGAVDTANDCVAIAALMFAYMAKLTGKVHVTADEITSTNDAGAKLLSLIKPEHARKQSNKEQSAAIESRDRFWTLYEQRWERNVWRAAAWLFGRAVDKHIPVLGARVGKRRHAAPTPPAPSPVPVSPAVAVAPKDPHHDE